MTYVKILIVRIIQAFVWVSYSFDHCRLDRDLWSGVSGPVSVFALSAIFVNEIRTFVTIPVIRSIRGLVCLLYITLVSIYKVRTCVTIVVVRSIQTFVFSALCYPRE